MAKITVLKIAYILSGLEILVLFIGGSILASFMISTALLSLILVTVSWLFVIFIEHSALNCASYRCVLAIGILRLFVLTGISVVPIVLAPYFSEETGPQVISFKVPRKKSVCPGG